MKRWHEDDPTPEEELRYLLPEGAKNLSDAFPPSSISVPDPVSVRDLAVALRMKPHFVMAGLMHFNILASLTTSDSPQYPLFARAMALWHKKSSDLTMRLRRESFLVLK